uniref:Uncharacterized protein n=1 Tax=Cacopsylla melanoneura TaxID=428564 RepID=A0A8D9EWS8_9HEMI
MGGNMHIAHLRTELSFALRSGLFLRGGRSSFFLEVVGFTASNIFILVTTCLRSTPVLLVVLIIIFPSDVQQLITPNLSRAEFNRASRPLVNDSAIRKEVPLRVLLAPKTLALVLYDQNLTMIGLFFSVFLGPSR